MSRSVEGLKAAADTTKQIITLSTVMIGFTVTFAKEFASHSANQFSVPISLKFSWFFFIASVFSAICTLMAITGSLTTIDQKSELAEGDNLLDANASNIKIPAVAMVGTFIVGLVLVLFAGFSI